MKKSAFLPIFATPSILKIRANFLFSLRKLIDFMRKFAVISVFATPIFLKKITHFLILLRYFLWITINKWIILIITLIIVWILVLMLTIAITILIIILTISIWILIMIWIIRIWILFLLKVIRKSWIINLRILLNFLYRGGLFFFDCPLCWFLSINKIINCFKNAFIKFRACFKYLYIVHLLKFINLILRNLLIIFYALILIIKVIILKPDLAFVIVLANITLICESYNFYIFESRLFSEVFHPLLSTSVRILVCHAEYQQYSICVL